jgi:hypothetical protein
MEIKMVAKNGFVVPMVIPNQRVSDLLIGAFEGGSTYWIEDYKSSSRKSKAFEQEAGISNSLDNFIMPTYAVLPLIEGQWIDIEIQESISAESYKIVYRLDREAVQKGLLAMASLEDGNGGHHWPTFLAENDDAETADVFLQCCLFGEIVFG